MQSLSTRFHLSEVSRSLFGDITVRNLTFALDGNFGGERRHLPGWPSTKREACHTREADPFLRNQQQAVCHLAVIHRHTIDPKRP
jgi:hypothetical protein